MIRKADIDHKDWDDYLPFFLFTCRDAPCSATGYSPFELIFGKQMHGPLSILKQQWLLSSTATHSVADWLL